MYSTVMLSLLALAAAPLAAVAQDPDQPGADGMFVLASRLPGALPEQYLYLPDDGLRDGPNFTLTATFPHNSSFAEQNITADPTTEINGNIWTFKHEAPTVFQFVVVNSTDQGRFLAMAAYVRACWPWASSVDSDAD